MAKTKKLDREGRYIKFHVLSRSAMMRVMTATEKARLAQALHPSRQAAHLEVAAEELRVAVQMLLDATVELAPMRKFLSYEERHGNAKKEVPVQAA